MSRQDLSFKSLIDSNYRPTLLSQLVVTTYIYFNIVIHNV